MTSADTADWQRVADEVRARRAELDLTVDECLTRSERRISRPTWSNLERVKQTSYRNRSLAGVCAALAWTPDSIDQILAGGSPTPLSTSQSPPTFANSLRDLTEREARAVLAFVNEMRRLDAALESQRDLPER